ncbi:hypothetical protein BCU93_13535 [Vibrio breoganii]|uniref:hypothetical protein n=1 Tax=Vibrio breoganii TaxID=553239 RepID=UPI000C83D4DA|nr:hypothetical protein [Vibrio breoganii]PMG38564.1 hypothetical protein BCU93_13535 [Vibrio breoganii]
MCLSGAEKAIKARFMKAKRTRIDVSRKTAQAIRALVEEGEVSKKSACIFLGCDYKELKQILND